MHRLGDRLDGVLARRVEPGVRHADLAGDRTDVDDRSSTLAHHVRHDRPRDAHDAEHVGVELPARLVVGHEVDRSEQLDAGVVDDDVEAAGRLDDRVDRTIDRSARRDVELGHLDLDSRRGRGLEQRLRLGGVAHRRHHVMPVLGERHRREQAEPRAASRDEDGRRRTVDVDGSPPDHRLVVEVRRCRRPAARGASGASDTRRTPRPRTR